LQWWCRQTSGTAGDPAQQQWTSQSRSEIQK
jgi:hypothetical protein